MKWDYSNAETCQTGTMQCTVCHQKITGGQYRYRQKSKGDDWGYVSQHRACTTEDPKWSAMDAEAENHAAYMRKLSDACREFRDKWGIDELDDYIIEDQP